MNNRAVGTLSTFFDLIWAQRLFVCLLALSLALLCGGRVARGDDLFTLDPSPEGLPIGTVQVGSLVEASVVGKSTESFDAGLDVAVTPPPFARLLQSHVRTRSLGETQQWILEVSIEIDTSVPGDYSGPLCLQLGDCHVEVPVSVTVIPADPTAPRVLVAPTPFQSFSTDNPSSFAEWVEMVEDGEIDVSYLTVDRFHYLLRDLDLSNFDVVVVADGAVLQAEDDDFEKLQEFAEAGGRVVIAANAFYMGSVDQANRLLIPNGMQIDDAEPAPVFILNDDFERINVDENSIDIDTDHIADIPWTRGVEHLRFLRPSPISVLDESRAQIVVSAPPFPGQGFVAVAAVGNGEMVAIGKLFYGVGSSMTMNSELTMQLCCKTC